MTAKHEVRGQDERRKETTGNAFGVQRPDLAFGSAVLGAERPTGNRGEQFLAEKAVLERRVCDLQARNAELQRKTDAKSRFLEVVAHDIRSPLAAILSALAELAKAGAVAGDPRAQKLFQLMRESGRRMLRFTDDLNDLAAIQSGRFFVRRDRVDFADVLQYARDVIVASAMASGRSIDVSVEVPNPPVWMHADEDRLAQALINLLENVEPHAAGGIRLICVPSVSDLEIAIQWGCEERSRMALELFEAAFSVPVSDEIPRAGHKAMLGLSIACAIVHAHGGEVRVEGSESGGARIVVTLRRWPPGAAQRE